MNISESWKSLKATDLKKHDHPTQPDTKLS
jgi:hypothetical protein